MAIMKTKELSKELQIEHWKKEKETVYTANDLINAWLKGKAEGAAEEKKILMQKFEDNIKFACEISSEIIHKIEGKGIKCKFALVGAEGISYFKSLLFIDPINFSSLSKLKSVYKEARRISQSKINNTFYITHSVLPLDKANINQKRILADGFFMRYGQL